jgi:hypothetical protein
MLRNRLSEAPGELAMALLICCAGIAAVVWSLFYPLQSRAFPFGIGVLTVAASVGVLLTWTPDTTRPDLELGGPRQYAFFLFLPFYLIAALAVGMVAASGIFVAAYLRLMTSKQATTIGAVVVGLIVAASLYFLFDKVLLILLYRGQWGLI